MMGQNLFTEIVERVTSRLKMKTIFWRKPLDVGIRVAITLRFLATGATYKDMSYNWRVAQNTISIFVPETCEAIIAEFSIEVMTMPATPEDWKAAA